jgi:hypothetical protein
LDENTSFYLKSFVYNKIKNNKTIGFVCLRSELTELKKNKMDVLSLGIVLLLVGLGLLLIAVIIKKYISTPY